MSPSSALTQGVNPWAERSLDRLTASGVKLLG